MDEEQEGEGDVLPNESELVELFGEPFAKNLLKAQEQIQIRQNSGEANPGFLPTYHNDRELFKLGRWASTQRYAYNQKKLSAERIKVLEMIEFQFSESNDKKWYNMFAQLLKFKEENGHCNVPFGYKNKELATWVKDQRSKCKDSKRREELDNIGFSWKRNEDRNEERRRHDDELRQMYEDDHGGLVISSDKRLRAHKRYAQKKAQQKVAAIKTSTTVAASLTIVNKTVSKVKKMNVPSPLFSSHFVSVSEDESDWGYHIHHHEELRTLNQTRQALYMRPDGTRLILNEDFFSFRLLLASNGKFQFFVDASGDLVQVNGGVSISTCLEHCQNYQEKVGKLVALSIQLMTPGTVIEARRREAESQETLWTVVPKFGFVMNSKDYSAGNYSKDADAHCSILNVLIGGEECIFKAKRPQIVLTNKVPEDSQAILEERLTAYFKKEGFRNWPKPEPKPQDDDALKILQVTSKRERTVFKGMTFVITGKLQGVRQETVKQAIRGRGGKVCESIKAGVKYHLVLGTHPSENTLAAANANKATVKLDTKKFLALCQGR